MMKKIVKHLALAGFTAAICLIWIVPANAQRGGGGHMGGGGGGHFGGGGFSGGHVGGGFSGGHAMSSPPRFNSSARGSFAPRSGFVTGNRPGFRGTTRTAAGGHGYAGYGHGAYNHGTYAHGGYGRGGYGHGGYGHGEGGRPYGWGRHDGYFYCHGYYGSLYYPYLGLDFGYLPYGYYPFDWDGEDYYFGNGLYYQQNADDQYTVVEPPIGASVNSLPSDAQSIVIDGQQYYELNGVYYSPIIKTDGSTVYQVEGKDGELNTNVDGVTAVEPKVGDIITKLPPDCKKVNLTGQTFYVSEDGIYYQEVTSSNNNKVYKIVGLESDQAGN